jgi:hypothetical protein
MALYYELPVYRDTYRLILKIFECTKDFSKEYKYTLGQDMKRDALQLVYIPDPTDPSFRRELTPGWGS